MSGRTDRPPPAGNGVAQSPASPGTLSRGWLRSRNGPPRWSCRAIGAAYFVIHLERSRRDGDRRNPVERLGAAPGFAVRHEERRSSTGDDEGGRRVAHPERRRSDSRALADERHRLRLRLPHRHDGAPVGGTGRAARAGRAGGTALLPLPARDARRVRRVRLLQGDGPRPGRVPADRFRRPPRRDGAPHGPPGAHADDRALPGYADLRGGPVARPRSRVAVAAGRFRWPGAAGRAVRQVAEGGQDAGRPGPRTAPGTLFRRDHPEGTDAPERTLRSPDEPHAVRSPAE